MQGKIIKGVGGFYYVAHEDKIYTCRAKGIFRKDNIKPMIGDDVEISILGESEGSIDDILPRKNSLVRPAVSNVDMVIAVQAAAKPAPQLYLLDRYLLSIELSGIPSAIVFNKCDLNDSLEDIYSRAGYRTFFTSVSTLQGIDELRDFIKGKSVVLAGPSGVGKSSLTNILCPEAMMETGGISRKIERGKHTTRHSEFFALKDSTFICDTPGFTSIEFGELEPEDLRFYFPEFEQYEGKCRFNGCVHISEPDCRVKEALENGRIDSSRYLSYTRIYGELVKQKERRY